MSWTLFHANQGFGGAPFMKECLNCGLQNDDAASLCATCHTALPAPSECSPIDAGEKHTVSAQELRFWERMTFRQFAVLMIRLQAVWLLFSAAVDLTYLPRYLSRWLEGSSYPAVSIELRRELALAVFRIVLHVGAALALIQYAERVLSWLVKDWVAKQPPNPSLEPTAAAGGPQGKPDAVGGGSRGSA